MAVITRKYEAITGRKPNGNGFWRFTDGTTTWAYAMNGSYREARRKAIKEAKAYGINELVLEVA